MNTGFRLRFTDEDQEVEWIVRESKRRGDPIPAEVVGKVLGLWTEFEVLEGKALIVSGPCGQQAFFSLANRNDARRQALNCLLCMMEHGVTLEGDDSPHTAH